MIPVTLFSIRQSSEIADRHRGLGADYRALLREMQDRVYQDIMYHPLYKEYFEKGIPLQVSEERVDYDFSTHYKLVAYFTEAQYNEYQQDKMIRRLGDREYNEQLGPSAEITMRDYDCKLIVTKPTRWKQYYKDYE